MCDAQGASRFVMSKVPSTGLEVKAAVAADGGRYICRSCKASPRTDNPWSAVTVSAEPSRLLQAAPTGLPYFLVIRPINIFVITLIHFVVILGLTPRRYNIPHRKLKAIVLVVQVFDKTKNPSPLFL
jgi:hypothetical protein